MKLSFSQQIKIDLCSLTLKKRCCRRSFLYGCMFASRVFSDEAIEMRADLPETGECLRALMLEVFGIACEEKPKIVITIPSELDAVFSELGAKSYIKLNKSVFGCELCRQAFLRGVFIECGTVNAPGRACHLEFLAPAGGRAKQIADELSDLGVTPGIAHRNSAGLKDVAGLYFKGSEAVEDVLNLIGAQRAAFELMDAKIVRELRNNANRCANCDTVNITKTVDAAQTQIEAISRVIAAGTYEMPRELMDTARLRIENPGATLAELAALHDPPLTKSGVKHRLDKILRFAN